MQWERTHHDTRLLDQYIRPAPIRRELYHPRLVRIYRLWLMVVYTPKAIPVSATLFNKSSVSQSYSHYIAYIESELEPGLQATTTLKHDVHLRA